MLGLFEVGFTLCWGALLALVYRHFQQKVADVEARLLEEVTSNAQSIEQNVEDAFADLQKHIAAVGDIDPAQSIELQIASMKAGIMGKVLNMGVEYLGNKFGMNLGLAEYIDHEAIGSQGDVITHDVQELHGEPLL